MSLINYKDIDFKQSINNENKIINFNGQKIIVLNYLPIHEIYDLILITLQKSYENGIYNTVKLNMYLDLHLVYLYTNIVFSVEDRADEYELYDTLMKSGLISLVKENINSEDLFIIKTYLDDMQQKNEKYHSSFKGAVEDFFKDLTIVFEKLRAMTPEEWEVVLQSPVIKTLVEVLPTKLFIK